MKRLFSLQARQAIRVRTTCSRLTRSRGIRESEPTGHLASLAKMNPDLASHLKDASPNLIKAAYNAELRHRHLEERVAALEKTVSEGQVEEALQRAMGGMER